ncbi:hypothetical protein ELI43_34055 [Rhizobium leguminosarum]|nr:hypothetical protein ELI43_34055 [Rhizobium leguminosarum]
MEKNADHLTEQVLEEVFVGNRYHRSYTFHCRLVDENGSGDVKRIVGANLMSTTKHANSNSFRRKVLRLTDVLLVALIIAEVYIVYKNVSFYQNKDLYSVFYNKNYRNFEVLDRRDELYIVASKYVDCTKLNIDNAERIDLLYNRIFFIETSVFLELTIGEQTALGCVEQVTVRKLP